MRDQNDSETLDSVYTYVSIQAELVKDADISRDDMLRAYKVWCRDIRRIEVFPVIGEEVILWGYSIIRNDESAHYCGSFTGPFEALADALEQGRHEAREKRVR